MYDVVLLELGAHEQVTNDPGVVGDLHANSTFNCPHRGQVVGVSSDPAGALGEERCIPGVPSLKNDFYSPEHLTRAPGVNNFPICHLHFDAQVALYSSNRIYSYCLSHDLVSPLCFWSLGFDSCYALLKNGLILSQKSGSLHPMQGWPASTGQLVPSLNLAVGQLLKVSGPLHPISYKQ